MGVDASTRQVLADLKREPAFNGGTQDLTEIRAAYDRVFSAWTAVGAWKTNEVWRDDVGGGALDVTPLALRRTGVLVFIHGGGWSLGSAQAYAPLARYLAGLTGMRVLVPDFPQAPEHPFPAAHQALKALLHHLRETIDGPLVLAGDSAGGTLCVGLSAEADLQDQITAQLLFYPVLDLRPDARYRSRRRLGSGQYFLSQDGIVGAAQMYAGASGDLASPALSPILREDLAHMPPSFISLPEYDPLRDEGELFSKRLSDAGVICTLHWARRTIHGCISFSGRLAAGRDSLQAAALFIERRCSD